MNAGALDRPIVIEERSVSQDTAGQETETWATKWTLNAYVRPARGDERFASQQVVGKNMTTFVIRYRPGVYVEEHRLRFDGKIWDLHDVRLVGRQEGLELDASARSETP